jgi:hypothetical protein
LYYEVQAAARSESAARVAEKGFVEFCRSEANQTLRRTSGQTLRRKAIVKTLADMQADPVWQSGSGLQCFDSGLKPEFIKGGTDKDMRSECDQIFEYDGLPKANGSQKVQAFKVCKMRHGGLCVLDPEAGRGDTLSKNTYNLIRVRHKKVPYPLFLKLSVPGAEALAEYFMLTTVIGKGDLVLLVEMVQKDVGEQVPGETIYSLKIEGEDCFPATLHMVSKQLVRRASAFMGLPALSITGLQFTAYKFDMPDGTTSLEVKVGGDIIFDERLSLVCVSHERAKPLKVKLPFGLSADLPDEPQVPNDDRGDDDSSEVQELQEREAEEEEAMSSEDGGSASEGEGDQHQPAAHESLAVASVIVIALGVDWRPKLMGPKAHSRRMHITLFSSMR